MKRKSGRKAALFLGRARWLNAPLFAWIIELERSQTFQPSRQEGFVPQPFPPFKNIRVGMRKSETAALSEIGYSVRSGLDYRRAR